LALLLWMVVAGEETVERGLRVPLELQQFPEGLELLGDVPTTVDVRVRGASGTLSRVAAGDIVAVLDLHGARPGQRVFPVTPERGSFAYATERVQQSATVGITEPELRLKAPRPVTVTVQIVPAPLEKTVHNRPVHLRNLGLNLAVTAIPDAVDVGLRGNRDALS